MSLICDLPDGSYSVSDILDYIEYHKKRETLPTNPSIHIYINRINNRPVFKTKGVLSNYLVSNKNK